MGPFVLLHVALVGFFGCAALYSAWTWWHARADRTLLLFAVQCLLSVVLSANFVVIATAGDVGRANVALSVRLIAGLVSMAVTARMIVERLLTERPGLRVIYMSGYTDDALVQHVVLNTEATYLQKPFDAETLSRKVRQAFEVVPPSPH